jgi:hypothetical protein
MMSRAILAWILGWFMMGHGQAARADEIYPAHETFFEPELGLVQDIQSGDEAGARRKMAAGLDIDQPVAPPATFDFKRIFGLSPFERKMANALTLTPAPSGGRSHETITLLNFFIANNDLPALRLTLRLGANPGAKGSFYYDSFRFASEFNRAAALDLLLQDHPFSKMTDDEQARRLADLPKIKTVRHWLSEDEYQLDPSLLEVANKYHPNFNLQMDEHGGGTLLTGHMYLSGYETVLWLLANTDADATLPDKSGRTVASITGECLRAMKADDPYRRKMLLKIKGALAAKGIPVD